MEIKHIRPDYWANFDLHNFAAYIVEGALFKNCYQPIFTEGCFAALEQHANSDRLGELARSWWEKIEDQHESMACYALQNTAICYAFWSWLYYRATNTNSYPYGAEHLKVYWQNSLIYPEHIAVRSFHNAARQIIALKSHLQRDEPTKAHFIQLFGTYLYAHTFNKDYQEAVKSEYQHFATDYQRTEFITQINQAIDILQEFAQLDISQLTQKERQQTPSRASDGAQGKMPVFY